MTGEVKHELVMTLIRVMNMLPFEDRANVAQAAGLRIECCPGCGCYIGLPDCPDQHDPYRPDRDLCVCPDNPEHREDDA